MKRTALVAAVILALAACGSGPSPQEWAGRVCQALAPWRTQIDDLNAKAATQMAGVTTTAQTRDNLVQLVSGGEAASETARAAVAAAGVPDVDGGSTVAAGFVGSLEGTRNAYAKARADLQALDTADEDGFYDGVAAVMARLTTDYEGSAVDLDRLSSPELREAFDGVSACR